MADRFLDTPRTEVGDMTVAHDGQFELSMEPSFHSPADKGNDLLAHMRGVQAGAGFATPRNPLAVRRANMPAAAQPKNEFTPLLRSATKNRIMERGGDVSFTDFSAANDYTTGSARNGGSGWRRQSGVPRGGRRRSNGTVLADSSALPEASSYMSGDPNSSSIDNDGGTTPGPPAPSSSAVSTPMLALPDRRGGGDGVLDGGNVLTLREQEARLEQIDKENFGLKLKIHFLEENLRRQGPELNNTAIKENTELKVDRMKLQQEVKRYRKNLTRAEDDLEQYRQHLKEYAEKVKRRHADEGMREEMDELRRLAEERDAEINELRERLVNSEKDLDEVEKLRDDVADLEAELRDKDRALEERDEHAQEMQDKLEAAERQCNDVGEYKAELQSKKHALEEKEGQIQALEGKLEAVEKLHDDIADLEADLRDKDHTIQERDDLIQELQEKVQTAETKGRDDDEKNQLIGEQQDQIAALQQELRETKMQRHKDLEQLRKEKSDELDQLHKEQREELDQIRRSKREELDQIQQQVDVLRSSESQYREDYEHLQQDLEAALDSEEAVKAESRNFQQHLDVLEIEKSAALEEREQVFRSVQRDLENEIRSLQRRLEASNREKQEDIRSLEDRLHLAESNGDNQAQLAQQAARETHEQLRRVTREKDAEVEALQARLDTATSLQDDLEDQLNNVRSMLHEREAEIETLKATDQTRFATADEQVEQLRSALRERDRQMSPMKNYGHERDAALREVEKLRASLEEHNRQLSPLKKSVASYKASLSELTQLKATIGDRDREVKNLRKTLGEKNDELHVLRQSLDEPDSQLEPLQMLVGQRDQELENLRKSLSGKDAEIDMLVQERDYQLSSLRASLDSRNAEVDLLQREAEDHRKRVQELQKALDASAHDHDDEVRILEMSIDNLEVERSSLLSRISSLESSASDACKLRADLDHLRDNLERGARDRDALRKQAASLKHDIQAMERNATNSTATESGRLKELYNMLRTTKLEAQDLALRLSEKDDELCKLRRDAREQLHDKDKAAKLARTRAEELGHDIIELERRHAAEIKGLARQIQYLRAKVVREEGFRQALAWEKRWFVLQVETFTACNKADLRLLSDMGIVPDRSLRESRPSLRTVSTMVLAAVRMRKMREEWASNKKLHEALVKKLESMRRVSRRNAVSALNR